MKKLKKDASALYESELVASVKQDFESRRQSRRPFELQWQLNIDFYCGNQNNYVSRLGTVSELGKRYFWQAREVYNHITPMIEARLAKLAENRAVIAVTPSTSMPSDMEGAVIAKKIIKSAFAKQKYSKLASLANMWAELTGTAFYKVVWNNMGGREVGSINGKPVCEGDVELVVCSPFEIYPDTATANDISALSSIIHAKPYKVSQIKELWGVSLDGRDIDVFDLSSRGLRGSASMVVSDAEMVIERYEMPSIANPNGRLVIVAGNKVLFEGDLPYLNNGGEKRGLPFVRQVSEEIAGCFWGRSVIERAIPVQRAYNSVKNRKTEFLNRLACGVMCIEEGSCDLDSLENEGLCPGKVIVYKQGSEHPQFLDSGSLPAELEREEERLLREFATISGSTELITQSGLGNLSGIALQILVEQGNKRMQRSINTVLETAASVGAHILRLYKQFAVGARLERIVNGGEIEMVYWSANDITSDEVTAFSAQEIADTPSAKRLVVLQLLESGLLKDSEGKISSDVRARILSAIGMDEFI